jgi:hypothetical protein
VDTKSLKEVLMLAWSAETAKGEWNPKNPSLNQCAITALVVQDYFGGELLRCLMTNGDRHYWNRLPDGTEVDLTEDQFKYIDAKPLKNDFVVREREYVLSFPETSKRYYLLIHRLAVILVDKYQAGKHVESFIKK